MAMKKGLGKGLDALFSDNTTSTDGAPTEQLKISEIQPNRNQPRKAFDDEALQQLADSIREHGVIQPILVRPLPSGGYQIVAGERRWRASRMAGLSEVPVIVREYDDNKAMEIALIENLQRENLNPIEEAQGYNELIEVYSMTQAEVSASVGKSRSSIANTLRLLNLPKEVLEMVTQGRLSSGHARALLTIENEFVLIDVAERACDNKMTVREVENFVKNSTKGDPIPTKKVRRESYFDEMEIALNTELNRKVKISGKEKGTIEIAYHSKEDLADLAKLLAGKE